MSNEDRMYQQLKHIINRLQTFPHANHEAKALNDCIILLIRTVAGEEIDMGSEIVGGGHILPDGQVVSVDQSYQNRGGVQISDGCIQYPPPGQRAQAPLQAHGASGAPIDIEAGIAALTGQAPPTRPDLLPKAIPGSLMDRAMNGKSVIPSDSAAKEMELLLGDNSNSPAPNPSETKVVVQAAPERK